MAGDDIRVKYIQDIRVKYIQDTYDREGLKKLDQMMSGLVKRTQRKVLNRKLSAHINVLKYLSRCSLTTEYL
jgi:hypothetical protein